MTAYETRKRDLRFFYGRSLATTTTTDGKSSSTTRDYSIVGKQETRSRENELWGVRNRQERRARARGEKLSDSVSRLDLGGTFKTVKHSHSHSHPWVKVDVRHLGYRTYSGPQFAVASNVGPNSSYWPTPPSDLSDEMIGKGATAIARTIPTNPVANVAVALGELREKLPAIPGRRLIGAQGSPAAKLADEYLNLEFGIKPMMSDFRDIARAMRTSEKTLAQLERDSGRLVRRRYDFPIETSTERVYMGTRPASPALDTYLYSNLNGDLYRERTVYRRFWFSGAYTYHFETGSRSRDKLRGAEQSLARLFGSRITPEVLWELTPWSWAADWVTNFGDVIHNVSMFSNDGLVLRWGYLMANVVISDTYTLHGIAYVGGPPQTLTQTFTTEVKQRIKATPYGFGLDPDVDFTSRQWAILAALGISRGAR